jgi:hypothetical protein
MALMNNMKALGINGINGSISGRHQTQTCSGCTNVNGLNVYNEQREIGKVLGFGGTARHG